LTNGSAATPAAHAPEITEAKFAEALDDDLNISAALGQLFEQIRESNRELDGGIDPGRARAWLNWWERINRVLALDIEEQKPPPEILTLAEERKQARLAREWQKSDELREAIRAGGWEARDTKEGQVLTRRARA
jgi:cysteinyl-tRNA synthetase